ncbi:glycoside hydrolase family 75 protein [Streptomyces sp. AC550_RSS872]|uniref:glycoside hydrolase family 75 protein n=1 Tax=Streptomyces sp. AC550_RSS872 TaxID=2823689 RepID=UPI001C2600CE|nr:glycoside hydrolase family 75 protein [Streptomyces sp. AC550_RSS872]
MRFQSLTLVAAGAALLAPTTPTAPPTPPTPPAADEGSEARREADVDVSAADLLSKVRNCAPVSRGRYRSDGRAPAKIPICGARGAVFWKADMDIDCDGRPSGHCNRRTDPYFSHVTAYQQSDGRHLNAERLPYIVVPTPSAIWDHDADGVHGGAVVAVVYRGRVRYAVVGDVGPHDIIGEASYATAKALGIPPDPRSGGTPSGVTYIVFKDSRVTPLEDAAAATRAGQRLAREFVDGEPYDKSYDERHEQSYGR